MKTKYTLLLIALVTLCGTESNCHRRYHRGGYGWGWGPAWGYGWGPSVTFAVGGRPARRNSRDDMGRTYWSVTNNSGSPILVRTAHGEYERILPGEKRNIHRRGSFGIKIKSPDGQRRKFKTRNHFIEISRNPAGRIVHNSWNE